MTPPKRIETPEQETQRKGVAVEVDGDRLHLIGKVRTFDGDIKSFESRIKTIREQMQEVLDGLDEYSEVVKLQAALEQAREHLKRRLDGNSEWIRLTEDLAEERLALKDAKANMSEFLLGYFHETGEKQIELGPKQARELILSGRLGKAKDFQTNLFSRVTAEEES